MEPEEQVSAWDCIEDTCDLYEWVRDGGDDDELGDRFSIHIKERGGSYVVDYQDVEEIATAVAFFYSFEEVEAAFYYAQDLMYQFESRPGFLTQDGETDI